MPSEFVGPGTRLSPADIEAEAADLRCQPAVIHAVCDVEAGGSGFLPDNRPKILFEAHAFWSATRGRFGDSNISSPVWDRALYGAGGAHQYNRLAEAMRLDREAALKSASWGMFQVMGLNHRACGYSDVETFVAALVQGERAHLDAFTRFCISSGLDDEIRASPPRFADFARVYNGPGYARNAYDTKLAAAWRKWRSAPEPAANPQPRTDPEGFFATLQLGSYGPAVLMLQHQLIAAGYAIDADDDFGAETQWAVVSFQRLHNLVPDGVVGRRTREALAEAVHAG